MDFMYMPNQREKIFDSVKRNDLSKGKANENLFSFLNRSSKDFAIKARSEIERIAANYPKDKFEEIRRRIRAGDDENLKSTCFELFISDIFRKHDCEIEYEPSLPEGNRSPDFLIHTPNGESFYVEATNSEWKSEFPKKKSVIDSLINNTHPHFTCFIEEDEGEPTSTPKEEELFKPIWNWLKGLDPEFVRKTWKIYGYKSLPSESFDVRGWKVTCRAYPHNGKKEYPIFGGLIEGGKGEIVDDRKKIVSDIKDKSDQVKNVDRPTIIALNVFSPAFDKETAIEALHGSMHYYYDEKNFEFKYSHREPNGVFNGKSGHSSKISAVWFFREVHPWSDIDREKSSSILCTNPWARMEVPQFFQNEFSGECQTE